MFCIQHCLPGSVTLLVDNESECNEVFQNNFCICITGFAYKCLDGAGELIYYKDIRRTYLDSFVS